MNEYFKEGKLEVYCGPMKSGKSKHLISRIDTFSYVKNIDFLIFKPKIDTREVKLNSRHSNFKYDCILINENEPEQISNYIKETTKVIFIDEIQFFSKEIIKVLNLLLEKKHHLIVSGLDLDFRGEPFGSMGNILCMADKVIKLKGVCEFENCNKRATHTQRLILGEPAKYDEPLVLIGDEEEGYQCRCRLHHIVIK